MLGAQIFKKFGTLFKILGARRVTHSRLQAEGPQILGTTVQNSVTWAAWCPDICAPWHPSHVVPIYKTTRRDVKWCKQQR